VRKHLRSSQALAVCDARPVLPGLGSLNRELIGQDPQKAHGAIMVKDEATVNTGHIPPTARPDAIGPAPLRCPNCDEDLGPQARIVIESSWTASKRPAHREAYLVCSSCRKAWVAALVLSPGAFVASAGSELAA
jgi:hypothetical protein